MKSRPKYSSLGKVGFKLGPEDLLTWVQEGLPGEEAGLEVQEVGQGQEAARDEPEAECAGQVADDVLEPEANQQQRRRSVGGRSLRRHDADDHRFRPRKKI